MKKRNKIIYFSLFVIFFCCISEFIGYRFLGVEDFFQNGEICLSTIARMRISRIVCSITSGIALSLSGLLLQCVLKNPLADPYILGISGGAGIGAVSAFLFSLHVFSFYTVPLLALCGAVLSVSAVLLISKVGVKGPDSLLLSGVIVGTMESGILMYLISNSNSDQLAGITWWMLGDLRCHDLNILVGFCCLTLVCCIYVFCHSRDLDLLSLGFDEAHYTGINPQWTAVSMVVLASCMTAMSVSVCGMIAFCGLIIPHIARKMFGNLHSVTVPACILAGAFFLTFCDLISRSLFQEKEVPPGVVTALVGGIIFISLLVKKRRIS